MSTEQDRRKPGAYAWWQRGIIYQVYPRSFQDSNGDGVGDLRGITQRLDYLRWLGVDAVLISPIYPSPMKDFGYDVADYCSIHPQFGTLLDFDDLIREAHGRGLKVILDFVPNHTSDQHPWFLESRSSRSNPKRDWYIWRDPAPDGGPPNNWLSNFGGSGWQFDEGTRQYYYHAFLPEQPDLNWRNPEVVGGDARRPALLARTRRGRFSRRRDLAPHQGRRVPGQPAQPDVDAGWQSVPRVSARPHERPARSARRDRADAAALRRYHERVLIGEIYPPIERLIHYYGKDMSGAHLPFNFQLLLAPWDARHIGQLIQEYEAQLPSEGWPNWVLGNHDNHRIASRVGLAQARIAAMLLLTLRGTPTLYHGDEIGMRDVDIPYDRVQDPFERNVPGKGLGRDPERTPMQWDAGPGAGFTMGEPWLPIARDYRRVNVHGERDESGSILALYRRLITSRRGEPALEVGRFDAYPATHVARYFRRAREGDASFLIALNLGSRPQVPQARARQRGRA